MHGCNGCNYLDRPKYLFITFTYFHLMIKKLRFWFVLVAKSRLEWPIHILCCSIKTIHVFLFWSIIFKWYRWSLICILPCISCLQALCFYVKHFVMSCLRKALYKPTCLTEPTLSCHFSPLYIKQAKVMLTFPGYKHVPNNYSSKQV